VVTQCSGTSKRESYCKLFDTGGSTVLTNEQLMNMLLLYKAESHI